MSELVTAKHRPRQQTYQLESIEGGWLTVRRFTHEERLDRAGLIMSMTMGDDDSGEAQGKARIDHKAARLHDFKSCIVDHNLSPDGARKYNFRDAKDVWDLDAEVGDEIDDIISEHQEVIPEAELPKSQENSTATT